MPSKVLATVCLTCDKQSTDALTLFDERWPRRLERQWRGMVLDVSPEIEESLHDKIRAGCWEFILQDLGQLPIGLKVFEPGSWQAGVDGKYEGKGAIVAVTPTGDIPWTIAGGAQISAQASWRIVNY